MKDLFQHVEHLLTEHDCVVVPGIGGFVLHDTDSRVDEAGEVFHPKGKEITFNSRLTFNDGILVQSFMESDPLSFEEAVEVIHERVAKLHEWLDEGRVVAFGRLGTLLKNTEGKLTFRPDNRNLYCPEAYGLTAFVYPTLAQRSKTTQAEQRHSIERKRSRERSKTTRRSLTFGQVLTGAAACLVMLLISKPVGQLKEHEAQEAFLLHSYVDSDQHRASTMAPPVAVSGINTQPTLKDTHIPDKEALTTLPNTAVSTPSVKKATPSKSTGLLQTWKSTEKSRREKKQPSTDDIDSLFNLKKPTAGRNASGKTDTGQQSNASFPLQPDDETSGPSPSDYFPYRTFESAAAHNASLSQHATTPKKSVEHASTLTTDQASAAQTTLATQTTLPQNAASVNKTTLAAQTPKANNPRYFIIISSHASKSTATQWLNQHRTGLYEQANIVEGNGRARIYLRAFSNKAEAESFLNTFRADHPQHEDAWLLCKRS
ncbi:MAG: hypothetical protein GX619_00045 [Bacteroidales bacterium]|jgi:hypothetical protein|nr:hypothetical protein [Bacteroidales bacterium]